MQDPGSSDNNKLFVKECMKCFGLAEGGLGEHVMQETTIKRLFTAPSCSPYFSLPQQ